MSTLYNFVAGLAPLEICSSHVIKTANARDLVMALPSPGNKPRDPALIPDVDVKLILSTTEKLPPVVAARVDLSEDRTILNDNYLLGLCLSGRGLPVEIFLHEHLLRTLDPTMHLFDEIAWHEIVHGIEGVGISKGKELIRETPWSYGLQQEMIEIDQYLSHASIIDDHDGDVRLFLKYMHGGTPAQQNVSEIFARVSVLYMLHIRNHGEAPDNVESLFNPPEKNASGIKDRTSNNLSDLFAGLATYSETAQSVFWDATSEMTDRIATLYGCRHS